ncbi:MAG: hypothetical protein KatS3mg057_2255 [Herpetosiphonaceae bacterium]|nr:MAG: hypothetical protein KatS3mg057_2255 [Herpetosiphonaceae bacterium]
MSTWLLAAVEGSPISNAGPYTAAKRTSTQAAWALDTRNEGSGTPRATFSIAQLARVFIGSGPDVFAPPA